MNRYGTAVAAGAHESSEALHRQKFSAVISRRRRLLRQYERGGCRLTPLYTEVVNLRFHLLVDLQTARFGPIGMEQLWNRGGATGGKGSVRRTLEMA
jgi:hypothetical protein